MKSKYNYKGIYQAKGNCPVCGTPLRETCYYTGRPGRIENAYQIYDYAGTWNVGWCSLCYHRGRYEESARWYLFTAIGMFVIGLIFLVINLNSHDADALKVLLVALVGGLLFLILTFVAKKKAKTGTPKKEFTDDDLKIIAYQYAIKEKPDGNTVTYIYPEGVSRKKH